MRRSPKTYTCSVDGCETIGYSKGFCQRHYDRDIRARALTRSAAKLADPKIIAKFWKHVDKTGPNGCWLWTGRKNYGYGYFSVWPFSPLRAHRYAYELVVGSIPEGLTLDHLCKTKACVNPAHLEPVTARENTLRSDGPSAINARRTHCKHGHPFDAENTVIDYRGRRRCRACNLRENRRANWPSARQAA